jgi:hypothetical protein
MNIDQPCAEQYIVQTIAAARGIASRARVRLKSSTKSRIGRLLAPATTSRRRWGVGGRRIISE